MHAQDDEAGVHFWTRMLARVLAQLAGTPEPLLPWLTQEVGPAETGAALQLTDRTPVLPSCALCSGLL